MTPKSFASRPGADVVEDFKAHVRTTGEPHTWKWHCHDAPARTAKPVLLDKFGLPDDRRKKPELWAKCPLCAPNHAKYTWGYLTWYPSSDGGDDAIRAIGHDCGGNFFGDAEYKEALDVFRREQDEQADRAFLEARLPRVPALRGWLLAITPWVDAAAQFRANLRNALPREFINQLLRSAAVAGALTAQREIEVVYRRPDGSDGTRKDAEITRVGTVAGVRFLDEEHASVISLRKRALKLCSALPGLEVLADIPAEKVARAAGALREACDAAAFIERTVAEAMAFADPGNIDQVQLWTRHAGTDAVAQVLSLDRRPKLSIYRYRRIGIPDLGMRPKVEVEIPVILRGAAPPPMPTYQ